MSNELYTGRVKSVEEYDGWAIYPDVAITRGVRPIAKGIDQGSDGGEAAAKRITECINAFNGLEVHESATISEVVANLSERCRALQADNASYKMALCSIREVLENNPVPGYAPILSIINSAMDDETVSSLKPMFKEMMSDIVEKGGEYA